MPKSISLKENNTISLRLGNGRMRFRGRVKTQPNAWVSKKDISANSYIVKTHSSSDWYSNVSIKSHSPFAKYERQLFRQIQIGNKTYGIYSDLSAILDQINDAREILSYETDWDGDGSLATNEAVFNNAISFLTLYSNFIYENYSNTILPAPYIDITRDGGISIFWENDKAKFLIIFKNADSKVAYFFAERTDTKIPFKSAIEINGPVDGAIASWMKTNLG